MAYQNILSVIKPITTELFKLAAKAAHTNNKVLKVNQKNVEDALTQHMNKINAFTSEISFKELGKPKSLFSIYIPLDISLQKLTQETSSNVTEVSEANKNASNVVEKILSTTSNNIVIVGAPGAGKTTTIKFIAQKLLLDDKYLVNIIDFPILIRLREDEISQTDRVPLFNYILGVFGIIIEDSSKDSSPTIQNQFDLFRKQTAIKILDNHKPLLIFDGLDEVADEKIRIQLVKDINEISLSTKNARFILTTRKGEDRFHINNSQVFEISALNDDQIKEFASKWFDDFQATQFLKKLQNSSVYDSAHRPLTLSHLCAIYEREGKIPEKSRSIYRKIVNLLILEWNLENQIKRQSKFNGFDADRKKEFLENMAFELSVHFNKNQFNTSDLQKCYANLCVKFDLPLLQMREVINEIQIDNGLIDQIAYDTYEFAHKSFQEYLAAEHIVKLPYLPKQYYLLSVPSEMALSVTLSSEPIEYLKYFIDDYLMVMETNLDFLALFFSRLKLEKPDFLDAPSAGFSLLMLHSKYCKTISTTQEISSIGDQLISLDNIFKNLLAFENIVQAIKEYWNFYDHHIQVKYENYISFQLTYKNTAKSLSELILITHGFYSNFLI